MTRKLPELLAELAAVTPEPPTDRPAAVVAFLGDLLVKKRQPLIDAILHQLAEGVRLDDKDRAELEQIHERDRKWQRALDGARVELAQQIAALRRMEARTGGRPKLSLVDLEA